MEALYSILRFGAQASTLCLTNCPLNLTLRKTYIDFDAKFPAQLVGMAVIFWISGQNRKTPL